MFIMSQILSEGKALPRSHVEPRSEGTIMHEVYIQNEEHVEMHTMRTKTLPKEQFSLWLQPRKTKRNDGKARCNICKRDQTRQKTDVAQRSFQNVMAKTQSVSKEE